MKRILLVLLSLAFLASPALADDTITSWTWSSVTGTFQAKLAALGWKNIPDQQIGTGYVPTFTPSGGGTITSNSTTLDWEKTGRAFSINGLISVNVSGTVTQATFPLPNGYTCSHYTAGFMDATTGPVFCYAVVSNASNTVIFKLYTPSALGTANFPPTTSCAFQLHCQTSN